MECLEEEKSKTLKQREIIVIIIYTMFLVLFTAAGEECESSCP